METRFTRIVCSLLWLLVPAWAGVPLPAGAGSSVGFSPQGGAEDVILEGIRTAEKSIKVAAYSLTGRTIATA